MSVIFRCSKSSFSKWICVIIYKRCITIYREIENENKNEDFNILTNLTKFFIFLNIYMLHIYKFRSSFTLRVFLIFSNNQISILNFIVEL